MPELDDRSGLARTIRMHGAGIRGPFFRTDSAGAMILLIIFLREEGTIPLGVLSTTTRSDAQENIVLPDSRSIARLICSE